MIPRNTNKEEWLLFVFIYVSGIILLWNYRIYGFKDSLELTLLSIVSILWILGGWLAAAVLADRLMQWKGGLADNLPEKKKQNSIKDLFYYILALIPYILLFGTVAIILLPFVYCPLFGC